MMEWWNALPDFEKFFWYFAIPATGLFFVQFFLSLLGGDADGGLGDADGIDLDADLDGGDSLDGSSEGEAASEFRLFSLRNIIIMFAFFGWGGILGARMNLNPILTVILSLALGIIAASMIAGIFMLAGKFKSSGTMDISNAIDKEGTAYLPIPEDQSGTGKVQLPVQGSIRELDAVTMGPKIPTGAKVRVLSVIDGGTVLVERI